MPTETTNWSAAHTSAQYRAIAWLRWRIFINNLRRKGSSSEFLANLLIIPFAIGILILPTAASGFGAWYFAHSSQFDRIAWILWGAFFFCQFLNIQIGQPGTTFDPTQLIRFPLRASDYVTIRLFFGLLSPANVASFFIALAVATGVTVALPHLWFYAFVALFLFFAVNVLFSRMVFAWVDRWLSTRRAREVFTACIFIFSLGIQWLNFRFNPAYNHHSLHGTHTANLAPEKLDAITRFYHHVLPWIAGLPPNITASALQAAQNASHIHYLASILGCAVYGAIFYAIFAWRTRIEYRGENFSSQAGSVAIAPAISVRYSSAAPVLIDGATPEQVANSGVASTVAAVLGKDFLSMRRNAGIFYALIGPMLPALYLAIKNASLLQADWLFPAALGMSMLGLAPISFNSFGLEGPGCQLYFIAPVRIRDVFIAKNIFCLAIGFIEAALVYAIISFNTVRPSPLTIFSTLLWTGATLLLLMTMGNRRSISAPKKIEAGRASSRQASQASALIAMGMLLVSAGIGAGLYAAEWYFDIHWLVLPGLAIFAIVAVAIYRAGLNSIDQFAFDNREQLFAELCKQ